MYIRVLNLRTGHEVRFQNYMRYDPWMTISLSAAGVYWRMRNSKDILLDSEYEYELLRSMK